MKRITVTVAILILALFPALAMGGMVLMDDEAEIGDVAGQVGITLNMSINTLRASSLAWGDSNGFSTYTTAAYLVYGTVIMPTIQFVNTQIDVGYDGTTSYLGIITTGNVITGDLSINTIAVGTTNTATTPSLGSLFIDEMAVSFGTIRISGH